MATRNQIVAGLTDLNFTFEGDIDGMMGNYSLFKGIKQNGDRTQIVWIQLFSSVFVVLSPFAQRGTITEETALQQPSPFGAKLIADWYCLADTVPFENLDANEWAMALESLPEMADILEAALSGKDEL